VGVARLPDRPGDLLRPLHRHPDHLQLDLLLGLPQLGADVVHGDRPDAGDDPQARPVHEQGGMHVGLGPRDGLAPARRRLVLGEQPRAARLLGGGVHEAAGT
jgi:hypothetical protein